MVAAGAAATSNSLNTTVVLCDFFNNTVAYVAVANHTLGELLVSLTGGINMHSGTQSTFAVTDSRFRGCAAVLSPLSYSYGSSIFLVSGAVLWSAFPVNSASLDVGTDTTQLSSLHVAECSVSYSAVSRLGATIMTSGGILISDVVDFGDTAIIVRNSTVTGCLVDILAGGEAVIGSAILVGSPITNCPYFLSFSGLNISYNTGRGSGSAMQASLTVFLGLDSQCRPASHFELSDTTFENNYSDNFSGGSAFYSFTTSQSSTVNITNVVYSQNSGSLGGGLLVGPGITAVVDRCTFMHNCADDGGSIYLERQAVLHTYNSVFTHNTATALAAGISSRPDSYVQAANCSFVNNSAPFGASMVLFGGLSLTSNMLSFTRQEAPVLAVGTPEALHNVNASNILVCPPGTQFQYGSKGRILSCMPCASGSYSFVGETNTAPFECIVCHNSTIGLDCSHGGSEVLVRQGYWAVVSNSTFPTVGYAPCPPHTCCARDTCPLDSQCSIGRQGRLCAQCKETYSLTITSECIRSELCGSAGAVTLTVFAVLLAGGFVAFLLWRAFVGGQPLALLTIFSYFYQIVPLIVNLASGSEQGTGTMTLLLLSIFNFRFRTSASQPSVWCPFHSLTDVSVLVLGYAPSLVLGVWLLLLTLALLRAPRSRRASVSMKQFHQGESRGRNPSDPSADSTLRHAHAVWVVVWKLLGFSYNSMLVATFELLVCVSVPNSEGSTTTVLFEAATTECYTSWQYVLASTLLPVLLLFPFVLAALSVKSVRACSAVGGNAIRLRAWQQALLTCTSPYRYSWWLGFVMFRRLVIVVVVALLKELVIQSWIVCALCLMVLLSHVWMQPIVHRISMIIETLLLLILVVLAIQTVAQDVYSQLGLLASSSWLFTTFPALLVLLPAGLASLWFVVVFVRQSIQWRRTRQLK